MSQLKNRLQALTLLDRAFAAITDEEFAAIVATLPVDHVAALDELCGARLGQDYQAVLVKAASPMSRRAILRCAQRRPAVV